LVQSIFDIFIWPVLNKIGLKHSNLSFKLKGTSQGGHDGMEKRLDFFNLSQSPFLTSHVDNNTLEHSDLILY